MSHPSKSGSRARAHSRVIRSGGEVGSFKQESFSVSTPYYNGRALFPNRITWIMSGAFMHALDRPLPTQNGGSCARMKRVFGRRREAQSGPI